MLCRTYAIEKAMLERKKHFLERQKHHIEREICRLHEMIEEITADQIFLGCIEDEVNVVVPIPLEDGTPVAEETPKKTRKVKEV